MSQRLRTPGSTVLLATLVVAAAMGAIALSACQNSADGVTPACSPSSPPSYDNDGGTPVDPKSYDPDCWTEAGDAGVLLEAGSGAGGSS